MTDLEEKQKLDAKIAELAERYKAEKVDLLAPNNKNQAGRLAEDNRICFDSDPRQIGPCESKDSLDPSATPRNKTKFDLKNAWQTGVFQ